MIKNKAILYTRKPRHLLKEVAGFYILVRKDDKEPLTKEEIETGKVHYPTNKGAGDSFLPGWVNSLKSKGLKVYYKNTDGTKGKL